MREGLVYKLTFRVGAFLIVVIDPFFYSSNYLAYQNPTCYYLDFSNLFFVFATNLLRTCLELATRLPWSGDKLSPSFTKYSIFLLPICLDLVADFLKMGIKWVWFFAKWVPIFVKWVAIFAKWVPHFYEKGVTNRYPFCTHFCSFWGIITVILTVYHGYPHGWNAMFIGTLTVLRLFPLFPSFWKLYIFILYIIYI